MVDGCRALGLLAPWLCRVVVVVLEEVEVWQRSEKKASKQVTQSVVLGGGVNVDGMGDGSCDVVTWTVMPVTSPRGSTVTQGRATEGSSWWQLAQPPTHAHTTAPAHSLAPTPMADLSMSLSKDTVQDVGQDVVHTPPRPRHSVNGETRCDTSKVKVLGKENRKQNLISTTTNLTMES